MSRFGRASTLGKPLIWNLVAAGTGQGATLMLTLVLANMLGPAQFGRFSVATSTILALGALAQVGLAFTATNFVARYIAKDRERAERVAAFCVLGSLVVGFGLGLTVAVGSWLVARWLYGDASLYSLLIVAGAAIPAATIGPVQNAVLIGLQAFRALAVNALFYATVLLFGAYCGYLAGGPLGAAIGYAVALTLRAVHSSLLLQKTFTGLRPWRRPAGARALLRELAPFSAPAALAGLTLTPAVWLSNAWLVRSHGLHELGLFSSAFMIKTLVVFVPLQIGTVFLPRYIGVAEADAGRADSYLLRVMLAVFSFSAAVAGAIALFAPWLMRIFGPEFTGGTLALRWLMVAVVAESVATIGAFRLAGERRMWTSLLAFTLPKDVTLLIAASLLTPRYGASGLAGAHLVSWTYGIAVVLALTVFARPSRRAGTHAVD